MATLPIGCSMSESDPLVVDASAALAIVLAEDEADWIRETVEARFGNGASVLVPELFWLEMASSLAGRHRQPMDVILESLATLDRLGLATVLTRRPGLLKTIVMTSERRLSAYDATYLALAEAAGADLLTLDRALADAAGDRAIRQAGGEVRELRGGYRLQPWITWDEVSDYLDAVRRVTIEEETRRPL